jgi:hypothetical protein
VGTLAGNVFSDDVLQRRSSTGTCVIGRSPVQNCFQFGLGGYDSGGRPLSYTQSTGLLDGMLRGSGCATHGERIRMHI